MGNSWGDVIETLTADKNYDQDFMDAYGNQEITQKKITQAIAAFESLLITPSPFDRYLRGEKTAISVEAAHGYQLFKDYGCVSCHQGINVGGNVYQKFGALIPREKIITESDKGRFSITTKQRDLGFFKVPSLRNVELTAPYFHNGSVDELEAAIRVMGVAQLGRNISDEDINFIAEFLRTLTGESNFADQLLTASSEEK